MTLPIITATGNLTQDVEFNTTKNGKSVAKLKIACNDRKFVNNQWVDGDVKPILSKYGLVDMYNQNEKLFYDFIRLSRNARSDEGIVLNVIEQMVKLIDERVI